MAIIKSYKIGAVCYVLWGVLHVVVGALLLYVLVSRGSGAALAAFNTPLAIGNPPPLSVELINGVIGQHAWNLLWIGLFAAVIGAGMNWKNSKIGYWLNLGVVSAADLGFMGAMVLPGHVSLALGALGPILWILGLIFTTAGYSKKLAV